MRSPRTRYRLLFLLFIAILLAGLVLRFYQYLMGRSLWEDEAHMALNFMAYGYADLLKPLDYIQAAPLLFLMVIELCTRLFGFSEYALRAFPFLVSVLTLPLFYYILLALTKNRIPALIGFLAFAVNLALVYFSSELKVYAVDVAVYLLMVYLAVTSNSFVLKHRTWLLAVSGCICLLCSSIAFLVLGCVVCNMLLGWFQQKRIRKADIGILISWACVFAINYFLFIYRHPHAALQKQNYAFAFPPTDILSCEFVTFTRKTIEETFFTLLLYVSRAYGFAWMLLLIFTVAIVHLVKRKRYTVLIFTCLPVLLHLLIATLRIYPFYYRLILYLVPPLMILMAIGTYQVAAFIARKTHRLLGLLYILVCCYFFIEPSLRQFPLWFREVKPSLDFMNTHYPGKPIYITTSYTLYKYYHQVGYAKDSLYTPLEWNLTPEAYYQAVQGEQSSYILFHTAQPEVDGYGPVLKDLKQKGLIAKQFEYKYYTVSEVRPLQSDSNLVVLNYKHFPPDQVFDLNGEKVAAIWSTEVVSKPISLSKGQYTLSLVTKGTPVASVYPHLQVWAGGQSVGTFSTTEQYAQQSFSLEVKEDMPISIRIIMDNDSAAQQEDRNTFIRQVLIRKAAVSHTGR